MSRDEAEPADDESGEVDGQARGERTDDAGNSGTTDDETVDDSESARSSDADSDRDEFGIASDLVTGRSDEADDEQRDGSRVGQASENDAIESGITGPDESRSREDTSDGEAPLSSLASSVSERRASPNDDPDDELFDEEEVPEIDADVVWDRLGEDEPLDVPGDTEHDVRVIEKRNYCEQCPFFSTPPDVGCEHEGTEILELVDMDHFRVVDCPKVLEDERLERL